MHKSPHNRQQFNNETHKVYIHFKIYIDYIKNKIVYKLKINDSLQIFLQKMEKCTKFMD